MKTRIIDNIKYQIVPEEHYHSCEGCEAKTSANRCPIPGYCAAALDMGHSDGQGYIFKRIPVKAKKEKPVKVLDETELFVAMQKKWIKLHGIKNGDKVRVIATFDGKGGCNSSYTENMSIGKVYEIEDKFTDAMNFGINLRGGPVLPYFCLEPVKDEPKVYHIGQRFMHFEEEYILVSKATDWVILIRLSDGCRYGEGIKVAHKSRITEEEFTRYKDFKLVQ